MLLDGMIARCCGGKKTCFAVLHTSRPCVFLCCESSDTQTQTRASTCYHRWALARGLNPNCSYYSEGEGLAYGTALIQDEAEVSANWKELRWRESRLRGGSVWFNSQSEAVAAESESVWEQPYLKVCVCDSLWQRERETCFSGGSDIYT